MIHIVMSRAVDFAALAREVAEDRSPTHVLLELARRVAVTFHQPGVVPFRLDFSGGVAVRIPGAATGPVNSRLDRLRAQLVPRAEYWALARRVMEVAAPEDVLFATGEDVGIPLAAECRRRLNPMRLIMTVHNVDRPRAKFAFRIFRMAEAVSHWVTPARSQAEYLRSLDVPDCEILMPPEQTDVEFFRPAAAFMRGAKPLIVSTGLEQRDYRTLAEATADLPVEVRISGFSRDARATARAFPSPLPGNMSRQTYDWPGLRELYWKADVVVVPLFENRYAAGINTLLEGLACGKPVIVSQTQGLEGVLDGRWCVPVPVGNAAALRHAIQHVLHHLPTAAALGEHGRRVMEKEHSPANWLAAIEGLLMPAMAS